MLPIFWDDGSAPSPTRACPIVNAGPAPRWVIPLGPVIGVWIHWYGGRSTPCLCDVCPACAANEPQRWAGYAPCLHLAVEHDPATGECKNVWQLGVLYVPSGDNRRW